MGVGKGVTGLNKGPELTGKILSVKGNLLMLVISWIIWNYFKHLTGIRE